MSSDYDSERTVQATPRRRAEARRRGQVPFSPEFRTALVWGGIALLLTWLGPMIVRECGQWLRQSLAVPPVARAQELTISRVVEGRPLWSVLGLLVAFWMMRLTSNLLQARFVWTPGNVRPQADRVNPLHGLRRVCSGDGCVRGGLWTLRTTAIGAVMILLLQSEAPVLSGLSSQTPGRIAVQLGELLISFLWRLSAVILGVGVIDLGWQWWKHERSLRMTQQQWREEQREGGRHRKRSTSVSDRSAQGGPYATPKPPSRLHQI